MHTLKNILVATDFSRSATNAMVYAINLAQQVGANLHILHVKDVRDENSRKTDTEIKSQFEIIKHDYLFLRQLNTRFVTKEGFIADEISQEALDQDIDLVIMGVKGGTGSREARFGSITATLIDNPPCSIIAVPPGCAKLDINRILLSSDHQQLPNEDELYVISFIAQKFSTQVDIFNVKSRESDVIEEVKIQEKFQDIFKSSLLGFHSINSDNVAKGISEFATSHDMDLITVFRFVDDKEQPLKRSISKQLALAGQLPLLIIPTKINQTV